MYHYRKREVSGLVTNKSATIAGITIDRIAGGKIVETWTNFDNLGI